MRIASYSKRRIAAGLLFAVLPSVVGHQVVRRLNSHGPEALLKRADGFSRHVGTPGTKPSYLSAEEELPVVSWLAFAVAASTSIDSPNRGLAPLHVTNPSVDLPLTPDPDWHAFILSTKEIVSF